jgi:hypothetical protein
MNPLRLDNSPRFQPGRKPFYEVYFLKFHLLEEGLAFWIRYTLHVPTQEAPWGGLWAFALEEKSPGDLRGGLQRFPMDQVKVGEKGDLLKMGEGSLREGALRGKILQEDFSMEWDLNFETKGPTVRATHASPLQGDDEERSLKLYPYDWMYRGSFPKTKYLIPFPSTQFQGRVVLQGKEYLVDKAPGEQAHIWGREHAKAWAWLNCNTFLEDSTAALEGLSATIQIGPFTPPPFRVFCLRTEGKEYPFILPVGGFESAPTALNRGIFRAIEGDFRLMGSLTSVPKR